VASLAVRVIDAIQRQHLAPSGARVLVAVSGGADSIALLHLLHSLRATGVLVLAGSAHLNHQLRGRDSDEDEAFCRAVSAELGVPFLSEAADVATRAREEKRSIEDAARRARYAFLERAADTLGADVIATAHTREDQAETFLLRMLRGAGSRGLGGIRPRTGRVIRPLLGITRDELRAFLAESGVAFREDATNSDVRIPRNRIRHELLPLLESQFCRGIVDVLARAAELARRDEDFLTRQAIDLARRIVLSENDSETRLAAVPMAAAHPALGSRVALAALERYAGRRAIGSGHVERLLELAARTSDGALSLPGQDAVRMGHEIVLRPAKRQRTAANPFAFPLSIPGEVRSGDWAIAAIELSQADRQRPRWLGRGSEVGIAAGSLALPLVVRNRRPGDRLRPLGAPGRRKLQDFLVDRKVPRAHREALPLVVDGRGRIVWVPGHTVAEEFRVRDSSQAVILFTVRRLGAFGE